MATVTGPVSKA